MTFELQMLFWASAILLGLLMFQGALVPINQGFAWGLGSRDEPRDMTALQGRMKRIVANHIESLVIFAALIVTAHLAGISTTLTQTGAVLFVGARLAFAAVYMAGLPVIRSICWGMGITGVIMIGWEIARTGV